ncbi:hypothetical protein N0V91_002535 [Didymella pomorum]|uniref:Uncharacterized protein n=1 Tax=Didymella pomorum TaxID=749634 RepID=A0A9W9D9G2_9PLEO|nr:hypothetical protein N0V91_002535 [Didymella pomorum]
MTTRQPYHSLPQTPELSLYDTEDPYSSDEEMPDREETDQLLRQAHHYVITEGGRDSSSKFMERIQRINEDLVQEISAHGYDCDPKLFRRVKHKIDHVLREFEDAVDAESSLYDYSDSREYYTAAVEESLYRTDSSPTTPDGAASRRTARIGGKDYVERVYLYGGPGNHPESWYKKAAASLPFPETIRMADWESLRIHSDLAAIGNMEKTEPVTGNGVSFEDPCLTHHNKLPQFESGSRFRLPTPDSADIKRVKAFASNYRLKEAVKAFYEGDESKLPAKVGEDVDYKWAPLVFLDRLDVGQRLSPAAEGMSRATTLAEAYADSTTVVKEVRSAVNTTPTKPPSISNGSSKVGSAPRATRALLKDKQSPSSSTPVDIPTPVNDDLPVTLSLPVSKTSQSKEIASGSTARRIKAKTEDSIRSPTSLSSAPANWETKPATHVAILKKTRGRTRKNATPSAAITSTYQVTKAGKRKRLSSDSVEDDQTAEGIELQVIVSRGKQLKRDAKRPYTPTSLGEDECGDNPVPDSPPEMTPGSSVMSTPPVKKARAAGKKQRRYTKCDFEQRVTPEEFAEHVARRGPSLTVAAAAIMRGSTRSGKVREL